MTRSSLVIVFIWRGKIEGSTLASSVTSARGLTLATWNCDNCSGSHDKSRFHKNCFYDSSPDSAGDGDRLSGITDALSTERTLAGSSWAGVRWPRRIHSAVNLLVLTLENKYPHNSRGSDLPRHLELFSGHTLGPFKDTEYCLAIFI